MTDTAYVTPEGWVVIGDETYTAEEWEFKEHQRQSRVEYRNRPDIRQKRLEQRRAWYARTREWRNEYNREWMRKYRQRMRHGLVPVAGLHDLRCTGPTRATGCRCKKIPLYRMDAV